MFRRITSLLTERAIRFKVQELHVPLTDELKGGIGIDISNGNNVTVENFLITNALVGIELENSANSQLIQNNITTYSYENGIDVFDSSNNAISSNNIVSYANLDGCQNNGIDLSNSFNNTVSKNNVVGSWVGISLGTQITVLFLGTALPRVARA